MYVFLCLVVALAAELGALRRLPYSTSWIEEVSDSDLGSTPTPDFKIGTLKWPAEPRGAP